jgi:hypothetical protein
MYTLCLQVQVTREVMQKQLSFLRDGRYIDTDTAEVTATFVASTSNDTVFSIVEIRTVQRETGGFSQTAHVWPMPVEVPKANMSNWQLAKWLAVQTAPLAFALASGAHLLVMLLPSQVKQQTLHYCSCAFCHQKKFKKHIKNQVAQS